MRPFCLIIALVAAALLAAPGPAAAGPAAQAGCPGNRLVNPSFDGGSRKTEAEGTSLSSAVSDGWSPWFVRGDAQSNREPEFKVEQTAIGGDPFRVRSGNQSMKWFTTWATHDAGIYQRVAVPAGSPVTFSIYTQLYSGEDDGFDPAINSFRSDPSRPGNYRAWVGIDPTGAVPAGAGAPPPSTVIWSEPTMATDTWTKLAVTARAQGNHVTVYARGAPEWGVKHNDSFWEDACLTLGGTVPGAPAAAAGAAAVAVANLQNSAPAAQAAAPAQPVAPSAPAQAVGPAPAQPAAAVRPAPPSSGTPSAVGSKRSFGRPE